MVIRYVIQSGGPQTKLGSVGANNSNNYGLWYLQL